MESPFDNANNVCCLYLEPFLNSHCKSYENILTVSNIPPGPLANMVARIHSTRLSPFSTVSPDCLLVISRYPCSSQSMNMKTHDQFMYAADIPNVIGYLETNGYKIMSDITNMAHKGPVNFANPLPGMPRNRKLVFMFKHEGNINAL